MSDPLGEFEHSINDVLMYLDTAFATRWREVNDERNMLLKSTEELHQVPFIELLPNFLSSGYRPSDLADCLGSEIRDEVKASFVEAMCTGLLQGIHRNDGATLYQHQTSILSESLEGKHCVITHRQQVQEKPKHFSCLCFFILFANYSMLDRLARLLQILLTETIGGEAHSTRTKGRVRTNQVVCFLKMMLKSGNGGMRG